MKTWEQTFQKRYQKLGINFQQKENVYTWYHEKANKTMTMKAEKKCGMLFVEMENTKENVAFSKEFLNLFKKWKKITLKWIHIKAKELKAKTICLTTEKYIQPFRSYSILEEFKSVRYKDVLLPKNLEKKWESTLGYNTLYKELEKGYIHKVIKMGAFIKKIIEKKGNLTTKVLERMKLNEKGFFIEFYHCGSIEEITIEYINEQFILSYGKKDHKKISIEKVEEGIKEMLSKIETKMKVKNLLIKPRYHFERFMNESSCVPFNARKDIYDCLLEKYSEEELEEELVIHYEKWKEKSSNRNWHQNVSIANVMGVYVILDENHNFIYATMDKENAIRRLKKEAVTRLEQEIQNEISNIE